MKVYIITGASRGLGKALLEGVIQKETAPVIYGISRKTDEGLMELASEKDVEMNWITYDLGDLEGLSGMMGDIMEEVLLRKDAVDGIFLVNNAGVIGPVKAAEHAEPEGLITNIHVNLLAPMILTGAFIRYTKKLSVVKRVMNISSGAAEHGYYGWSAYCASKAGINLFTETVGIEQGYQDHGVGILSLAPGIVDTDMQGEIRDTDQKDFVDRDRFVAFKENGDLTHPEVVAEEILRLLNGDRYPMGANLDIRDMEEENWYGESGQ